MLIVKSLLAARDKRRCYLLAWCLMPEHIHMLVIPREEPVAARPVGASSPARFEDERPNALSYFVAGWASSSAHLVNRAAGRKGPLWQEGFHDHRVRHTERLDVIADYIHNNPVRRGLVDEPAEWKWSSANHGFAEQTDWDRLEDEAPTGRR